MHLQNNLTSSHLIFLENNGKLQICFQNRRGTWPQNCIR